NEFRFRPGDQHSGRNFEIQFEKFLVPGEILQRFAPGSPRDQISEYDMGLRLQLVLSMSDNEAAVPAQDVSEQRTGFTARLNDPRVAEDLRSFLKGGFDRDIHRILARAAILYYAPLRTPKALARQQSALAAGKVLIKLGFCVQLHRKKNAIETLLRIARNESRFFPYGRRNLRANGSEVSQFRRTEVQQLSTQGREVLQQKMGALGKSLLLFVLNW